jgi:2-C-methyl-D-erythritol 4-phosphate cytidylyltransferase
VELLVVAAHPEHVDVVRRELADLPTRVDVTPGGATRQESVHRALQLVSAPFEHVLVHDAARPLAPEDMVVRVLDALRAGAVAVVPAVAIVDTLRATTDDGASRPLDRTEVRAVQTPQGFRRSELVEAHAKGGGRDATDDASLVEALGYQVRLVDGDALAFKITRPLDLLLAETVLADAVRSDYDPASQT